MNSTERMNIIKKNKESGKFSKKVVISVIAMNVLFTIAVLLLFLRTGNEPMALVGAWFAFTTVELWSLAKIKKEKEETKRSEFENTDC